MMIASQLDPALPKGIGLDPALPAASKSSSSSSSPALAKPAGPPTEPPPERAKEKRAEKPERADKPDAKKREGELKPRRVVVEEGGLGLGAKLGIVLLIVAIAGGAYVLRQSHTTASTPVGGGRTVAFGGAVEPTALVVAGAPATRFTTQRGGGTLEVVYLPDLPAGKGVDVVITELYGPGVTLVSSGARLAGVLYVHGDGELVRDKAALPGQVRAYVGDKEAWILAAMGAGNYASSAEAQKFLTSLSTP